MSSRNKNIIYGSIAIVFLVAILIFLLNYQPSNNNISSTSSDNKEILLLDKNVSDILSVKIENNYGEYVITGSEGNWTVESMVGYPQSQEKYSEFMSDISKFTVSSKVEENASDTEKYGFSKPSSKVLVKLKDETSFEFELGLKLVDETGYYLKLKENNTVYIMKLVTAEKFLDSSLQFIQNQLISGNKTSSATKVEIKKSSQSSPVIIQATNLGDSSSNTYKVSHSYEIISPVRAYAENSKVTDIMKGFSDILASSVVGISPSTSKLSEYGFDDPVIVSATIDGKIQTIKIGKGIEQPHSSYEQNVQEPHTHPIDSYYVMLDGADIVYKVDTTLLPWLTFDYSKSISSKIISPNLGQISKISINISGTEYLTEISGEGNDLSFKINEKDVDTAKYDDFYKFLISTPITNFSDDSSGDDILSVKFFYKNSSFETDTLIFKSQGSRKVVAILNNNTPLYVNKSYVEAIIDNVKRIYDNQSISSGY